MSQNFLFDIEKKEVETKEIVGKTDYGKRKELTFFLEPEEYEEITSFFQFKDDHDEPNGKLLLKLVRRYE